nr:hypothetical protein [Pyrinomonadaceae bacterium]
ATFLKGTARSAFTKTSADLGINPIFRFLATLGILLVVPVFSLLRLIVLRPLKSSFHFFFVGGPFLSPQ